MEQNGAEGIIFAMIGLFGLCIVMVLLFLIFQKKKKKLLETQIEIKRQFEQEISETQVEIKEQTLRNISWELHDNIGQLLTLAKIQLQSVAENPNNITEVNTNLTNILAEVRSLSKTINPEYISKIKLGEAIQLEIDRFNRLKYLVATLTITGNYFEIDSKTEIIIFRMLQEFFSNTIKHSRASELNVSIHYIEDKIEIIAFDNGKGFNIEDNSSNGIGMNTMKKRGQLINAKVDIESELKCGTKISIIYSKK